MRAQRNDDGTWLILRDEGAHCDLMAELPATTCDVDSETNAALFAAAPELLAACQAVWLMVPFDSAERRQIVAAIHKAKHVEVGE